MGVSDVGGFMTGRKEGSFVRWIFGGTLANLRKEKEGLEKCIGPVSGYGYWYKSIA